MRTSGEELRDAGSLEAALSETDSSAKTRASGTHNDGVVLMINHLIRVCNIRLKVDDVRMIAVKTNLAGKSHVPAWREE